MKATLLAMVAALGVFLAQPAAVQAQRIPIYPTFPFFGVRPMPFFTFHRAGFDPYGMPLTVYRAGWAYPSGYNWGYYRAYSPALGIQSGYYRGYSTAVGQSYQFFPNYYYPGMFSPAMYVNRGQVPSYNMPSYHTPSYNQPTYNFPSYDR